MCRSMCTSISRRSTVWGICGDAIWLLTAEVKDERLLVCSSLGCVSASRDVATKSSFVGVGLY
eukprot:5553670-Alexandrium_andersonii.AAC.1